jgi:mono/diheme cytochrome c family protein
MNRMRFGLCSLGILAVAATLAAQAPAGAPAGAQGRGAAPAPTNLQVLPKDTPAADVRAMMTGFAQGLGVQCAYCHVAEGRGGRNDFAADEKATKKVARVMMKMVMTDNDMIAAGVGKPAADVVKVQCVTCHRGAAIPKVEMPAPAAAPAPGN